MIHDLHDRRLARAATDPSDDAAELDQIKEMTDYSPQTLSGLRDRITRSRRPDQLVYREIELDVVWRLVDCAVVEGQRNATDAAENLRLTTLRAAIIDTHDLLGGDTAPAVAAARLVIALT